MTFVLGVVIRGGAFKEWDGKRYNPWGRAKVMSDSGFGLNLYRNRGLGNAYG